jgi:tryptophan 2,3-dioxygenase
MSTPYNEYVRTGVLHSLQDTVTDAETELSFLVVCQIQELYFGLIAQELHVARDHLRTDDVAAATFVFRRVAGHFQGLNASWASLEWIGVDHFLPIKEGMTARFGKSSSLQSWKFRELAYLLGIRSTELAKPVAPMSEEYRHLVGLLATPCVYRETLALLHRRGLPIPVKVFERKTDVSHEPLSGVEAAWVTVLTNRTEYSDLAELAEALLAVAHGFAGYRDEHLLATHRAFGDRPGYYGQAGTHWLAEQARERPFPELWTTAAEFSGGSR